MVRKILQQHPHILPKNPTEVLLDKFLQLVLLSIILVGQKLQNRHAELRADADYETNLEVKKDAEKMMKYLETIEKEKLDKILEILEKK